MFVGMTSRKTLLRSITVQAMCTGTEFFFVKIFDRHNFSLGNIRREALENRKPEMPVVMRVDCLQGGDVLADGFTTLAYTYIGPELTHPIYKNGTIGQAKNHLYTTVRNMSQNDT